jgi:heptaprenyl diphosphate synthase
MPAQSGGSGAYHTSGSRGKGTVRKKTESMALMAIMLALMLVLGFVESMIPLGVGIPGIKLGLANGVLLFALYMLGTKEAIVLMVLKVTVPLLYIPSYLQTIMYSAAGSILSMAAMLLLIRIRGISILGVSVSGAVMHNVGQVLMAMLILQTGSLLYYLSVLLVVGVITGILTGTAAKFVMQSMKNTGRRPD